jgi:hypothetical protein
MIGRVIAVNRSAASTGSASIIALRARAGAVAATGWPTEDPVTVRALLAGRLSTGDRASAASNDNVASLVLDASAEGWKLCLPTPIDMHPT